jgi:hypothetical protein
MMNYDPFVRVEVSPGSELVNLERKVAALDCERILRFDGEDCKALRSAYQFPEFALPGL